MEKDCEVSFVRAPICSKRCTYPPAAGTHRLIAAAVSALAASAEIRDRGKHSLKTA